MCWWETAGRVFLDGVVEAMRQTGADILSNDKDTSLGGLAVSFIGR
jgi:L-serine deaminase